METKCNVTRGLPKMDGALLVKARRAVHQEGLGQVRRWTEGKPELQGAESRCGSVGTPTAQPQHLLLLQRVLSHEGAHALPVRMG